MTEFLFGVVVGAVFMFILSGFSNSYASYQLKTIEIGHTVCSPHGGLKSYDSFGEFVCANGIEIEMSEAKLAELRKAGSK